MDALSTTRAYSVLVLLGLCLAACDLSPGPGAALPGVARNPPGGAPGCPPAGYRLPSPPEATAADRLTGVAAPGPGDIWAVGAGFSAQQGPVPLAWHWNGLEWRSTRPPGGNSYLEDVAALAPSDVWAVGGGDSAPADQPLLLHWTGTRWSRVARPNPSTETGHLYGIGARAAGDIWAVGSDTRNHRRQTLVLHWDGTAWSQIPSPNVDGADSVLLRVAARAADDVWAVGYSLEAAGSVTHLADGPPNALPRPGIAPPPGPERPLIIHWDGTQWRLMPLPDSGPGRRLTGIAAVAADDAWAVGGGDGPLIAHWDGQAWRSLRRPEPGSLAGVTAAAADDVWAVGGTESGPLALHWDGAQWRSVPGSDAGALSAAAIAPDRQVWAVGDTQTFARSIFRTIARSGPAGAPVSGPPLIATLLEEYTTVCGTPTPVPTATPTPTPTPQPTDVPAPNPPPPPIPTLPPPASLVQAAGGYTVTVQPLAFDANGVAMRVIVQGGHLGHLDGNERPALGWMDLQVANLWHLPTLSANNGITLPLAFVLSPPLTDPAVPDRMEYILVFSSVPGADPALAEQFRLTLGAGTLTFVWSSSTTGPLSFDFRLPYDPLRRVADLEETVGGTNGMLTLERLVVTRSQARVTLRFSPAAAEAQPRGSWTSGVQLRAGVWSSAQAHPPQGVSYLSGPDGELVYTFLAPLIDNYGAWRLHVQDIQALNVDHAWITGPWDFRFNLPGP
ncbi:MAG TPA: hypothetical protein VKY74_28300 [Chloroflexia bacterium]|nr:hypothetical protein [Chloroflexia bacterium]